MKYEITAELNLQTLAAEARETAEAFIELAESLERIEAKYKKSQKESEDKNEDDRRN